MTELEILQGFSPDHAADFTFDPATQVHSPKPRRKPNAIRWLVKTERERQPLKQQRPFPVYQGLNTLTSQVNLAQAPGKPNAVPRTRLVEKRWELKPF